MPDTAPHPHAAVLARTLLAVADDPAAVARWAELVRGDPGAVGRIMQPAEPEAAEGNPAPQVAGG